MTARTSERDRLLTSLATTLGDYRAGEIAPATPAHVDRWVNQFDSLTQIPLLQALAAVLERTYMTREVVVSFFSKVLKDQKLAGKDPAEFWRSASVFRKQQHGHSQAELVAIVDDLLYEAYGFKSKSDGTSGVFVYIDDVLFTGSRVGNDLAEWIRTKAPQSATVHAVFAATHTFGEWKVGERIKKEATAAGRKITPRIWRARAFENRMNSRDASEVLWPSEAPDDAYLAAYMAKETKYPFEPRRVTGATPLDVFPSEQARQLLEREFLLAGARILGSCQNPSSAIRPLGFGPFGLGFGGIVSTFRNCPNNCPLALWWGDPDAPSGTPLGWYPLLPRKTYASDFGFSVEES